MAIHDADERSEKLGLMCDAVSSMLGLSFSVTLPTSESKGGFDKFGKGLDWTDLTAYQKLRQ